MIKDYTITKESKVKWLHDKLSNLEMTYKLLKADAKAMKDSTKKEMTIQLINAFETEIGILKSILIDVEKFQSNMGLY